MCGICGILDYSGPGPDEQLLWSMTETLRHRGPDDSGVAVSGRIGLGQTRLSIIDLTDAGHQPMTSEDGKVVLAYNGELYNFPEIRRRLQGDGVRFRGRSDTEVVLQSYIRWGRDAFVMFNGMFALAIWDSSAQQLILARDRFGIKPLYYYELPSGIVFGSEIKAVLKSGRMPVELDWAALHEYLYYGQPWREKSLFGGLKRLLPGSVLSADNSGVTVSPYWSIYDIRPRDIGVEEATEVLRHRLDKAVCDHLISDVPVGVFLSGGIDSSAITALASKHYQGRIQTFSVGFDWELGVNELPKARLVAERFGTDHHELHVQAHNATDIIERLVRCHDEPFADAANIPLYMLAEGLGGSIKVILQGDGGDEIFAGYRRYNVMAHERFWRGVSPLGTLLKAMPFKGVKCFRAIRRLGTMASRDPAMRMAAVMSGEAISHPPTRVLSSEARRMVEQTDPFEAYRDIFERLRHLDPVQRMLYSDCLTILPNQYLEKVDRATMAHSIEVRVPFLDANLTEYAMALPSSLKLRRMQKKWILRRALRGLVPDSILDGKKTGFGVPFQYWLRGPLADYTRSVLLDPATRECGLFDSAELTRCIDEHCHGRRDNGLLLYKMLNLALWLRFYVN